MVRPLRPGVGSAGRGRRDGGPHHRGGDPRPDLGGDIGRRRPRPDPVHRSVVPVRAERRRHERRHRGGVEPLGGTGRDLPALELQPQHREVLRVLPRLGPRSRQLSAQPLGDRRASRRSDHLGRVVGVRLQDLLRPRRADGHRDVPGDRLQHGRPGTAVVVRGVDPGRERKRRPQLARDDPGRRVHGVVVRRSDDRRGVRLEAASNNEGLIAGQLSYILNSISAYRTSQEANPEVAADTFFSAALEGPADRIVATHVMYNWIIPNHAQNVDAAKEFLLHYTLNYEAACWHSQLYDFPAWDSLVPKLGDWVADDPFGSQPSDKLAVLSDAINWSTNVGHPGPANPATGQIFGESIIPVMFAEAARGEKTPEQAVADAEAKIQAIYADWRQRGLVGGDS